jgi:uncharacterized protein YkwD
LEKQEPLEPYIWHPELSMSASDHAKDNGPRGMTGHTGNDKSTLGERIKRYTDWAGCTENISYGSHTGLSVILSLFIDSGIKNRAHRTNMQMSNMKYMGYSTGPHSRFQIMTNMDYTSDKIPKEIEEEQLELMMNYKPADWNIMEQI